MLVDGGVGLNLISPMELKATPLAKFMAASHYAYNTLKMPGPMGIISIPSDKRDAIICVD